MIKFPHLDNAPIVEAIIDFRVKLPQNFQVEKFLALKEKLKNIYPKTMEQKFMRTKVEVKDEKITSQDLQKSLEGYFFKSEDEKNIAQFRINGFTFNRLKPYTSWEEILPQVKDLWSLYIDIASPESITRVAVRYINHIEISKPDNIVFSDYLKVPPKVPDTPYNIPSTSSNFLTKIVINDLAQLIEANFIQAFEIDIKNNLPIIILDIDAFKKVDIAPDNNEIWNIFEQLHEMKNKIFFNSITDKTLEQLK